MTSLDEFVNTLSRLPGIGRKMAIRISYHFLQMDEYSIDDFLQRLSNLRILTRHCTCCGCYSQAQECIFCNNPQRNKSLLCIVAWPQDVLNIENSRSYTGLYHVLSGLISPIDGIGPDELHLKNLENRTQNTELKEIILATDLSLEGDATALYIQRILSSHSHLKISRIASGLPVGSELQHADHLTLSRSLKGRTSLN